MKLLKTLIAFLFCEILLAAAVFLPIIKYQPVVSEATPTPQYIAYEVTGASPRPEQETRVSVTTEPKRSYNGICEGDTIQGELTFYDVCIYCCGKLDGVTASGLIIQNGTEPEIPVASCNWLPLGTLISIDGVTYIVADRGGSGLDVVGRLDIFEPDGHEAALQDGRQDAEITIIKFGGDE